ncbi:MAG: S8 family serine peptidase, partial [Nanoarchaeota archaeon]|nr:S8 family serine peptidase [Nanoarchaeota archaeon]
MILIAIVMLSGVLASDKVSKTIDKRSDMIAAYGLDMPKVDQMAGVTVGSQIREKLQTDKKVRAIITMKEPKAVKGWSKKVAAMGTNQVKELKKAAMESAINNIGRQRVKHKYNSFNGFSASLTQEEFNDLIASGMVESIEYDEPFYISLQDSTGIINATESWSLQFNGTNLTGEGQTVCVIDTGVDYTHPDLGGCNISQVVLNGTNESYILENLSHPYSNDFDYTWNITKPGYENIAIHFKNISLEYQGEVSGEDTLDRIIIYDSNMNEIANYHGINGVIENLWTPYSQGDTISVRLITDGGFTDYGFYIDYVLNGTTNTTYNWSGCSKVIQGWDFVNNDGNPMDDHYHGTHCAGIIAANGEIKGVAPDAQIIAVKSMDSDGSGWSSDILAGIEYCTNNAEIYNISIISMSLGGGLNRTYCDDTYPYYSTAINNAIAKNISVIVASGNDGDDEFINSPACIQNATPVGATLKNDSFADYSNRNWMVQLFAPGSSINSTKYPNSGYTLKSGTSMATPHVAGAFAIINQYLKLSGQSKTPQEIESIFNGTGKQIYDGASNLTYGRIDLYEALLYAGYVEVTIVSPEAETVTEVDYIFINVTSNEDLYNTTLHIVDPSENISMNGSGKSWYYNFSGNGSITFFVTAKDVDENQGQSENRSIFLNNSAPNITQTSPATEINISEPNNQTFSINYTDDGPYTSIKWYLNSTLIANETTEWNFTGNYSSAGSYNISIIINDSMLYDTHSWILNVNYTNKPLYWLHSFINLTLDEDSSITYDVNATDNESDTITYSLNTTNTTEISIDNDTGLINFTPAQDWYGLLPITVTASDGVNNITGEIVFNVTPLNDAPQFTLTYNATYNESETINITVNATDIDNDNLTYGINDTRFTLINDSFIWNTTYQDSESYYFKVNVNDGNQVTETIINITILEVEDVDNDGINDSADYLEGDAETIISNISLNISIGNLTNLSQEFNGTHEINISYNASSLLEFNWTFNNTTMLNLSAITIEKQPTGSSSGYLLVKGLNLTSQASTKTIYVAKLNTSIPSICIKDAEIDSINNISSLCNENDETPITCPGSSDDYNCNLSDDNHTFVITGLSHSGVRQQTYCGDGTRDADEECDSSDFGSETCITKGYDLGSLNCNSDCIIS